MGNALAQLTTLLALALAQAASTPTGSAGAPFFTNDVTGFIKILATFGSMIGVMITLVVRLTQGKYTEQVAGLQTQLDGLGNRVNDAGSNCTRLSEAQRAQELLLHEHTGRLSAMQEAIGGLRASAAALQSHGEELHRDMLGVLTESSRAHFQALKELEIALARIQERDKLAEALTALARVRAGEKRPGDG